MIVSPSSFVLRVVYLVKHALQNTQTPTQTVVEQREKEYTPQMMRVGCFGHSHPTATESSECSAHVWIWHGNSRSRKHANAQQNKRTNRHAPTDVQNVQKSVCQQSLNMNSTE